MNNYAYVTGLFTNDYFKYLEHFIFIHKMHHCKYPIHVILTERIDKKIIDYLDNNRIKYSIFKEILFNNNNRYKFTRNKFYAWKLPYDKVLVLDVNSYFINLDEVLEQVETPYFNIQYRNNFSDIRREYLTIDGKTYIIHPNEDDFNKIISIESTNEESVLNQIFLKDIINNITLSSEGNLLIFKIGDAYTTGVTKLLKEFKPTGVWD